MIERILLAVADAPDSLAATRLAVELAGRLGAQLRAVHVAADHRSDAAIAAASSLPAVPARREQSAAATLHATRAIADRAGVPIETALLPGAVGPAVLAAARAWPADLLVVGKSARSASGDPYVGSQTRHVLEFAEQPVLVVPAAGVTDRRPR